MVASVYGPDNAGMTDWVAFRWAGGTWQFLMKRPQAALLAAAGSDIWEKVSVYRAVDPRCCPSGGTKTRLWHWNGSRFKTGPWKATPGSVTPSATAFRSGYFQSPSRNIQCDYGYGNGVAHVRCGIKSGLKPVSRKGAGCFPNVWVVLNATGVAGATGSFCAGEDAPDAGPFAPRSVARVLGYGKEWSGGGLRCTSAATGLTCRNKSGHGFFLSREHWRAF